MCSFTSQASPSQRELFGSPLVPKGPQDHCAAIDVELNPAATFEHSEMDNIIIVIRDAVLTMHAEPALLLYPNEQVKISTTFWLERVVHHFDIARVQKMDYQSPGDWHFMYDLEQAARRIGELLNCVEIVANPGNARDQGFPEYPWSSLLLVYKCLHRNVKQVPPSLLASHLVPSALHADALACSSPLSVC